VWPFGYFLRARLRFLPDSDVFEPTCGGKANNVARNLRRFVYSYLGPHRRHMMSSHIGGLPELTNFNGECAIGRRAA
jgi:hypothetical protein